MSNNTWINTVAAADEPGRRLVKFGLFSVSEEEGVSEQQNIKTVFQPSDNCFLIIFLRGKSHVITVLLTALTIHLHHTFAFVVYMHMFKCKNLYCVAAPQTWRWKSAWMSVWRPWISSLTTTSARAWRGCGQGNRIILSHVSAGMSVCFNWWLLAYRLLQLYCTFIVVLFLAWCQQ